MSFLLAWKGQLLLKQANFSCSPSSSSWASNSSLSVILNHPEHHRHPDGPCRQWASSSHPTYAISLRPIACRRKGSENSFCSLQLDNQVLLRKGHNLDPSISTHRRKQAQQSDLDNMRPEQYEHVHTVTMHSYAFGVRIIYIQNDTATL